MSQPLPKMLSANVGDAWRRGSKYTCLSWVSRQLLRQVRRVYVFVVIWSHSLKNDSGCSRNCGSVLLTLRLSIECSDVISTKLV